MRAPYERSRLFNVLLVCFLNVCFLAEENYGASLAAGGLGGAPVSSFITAR